MLTTLSIGVLSSIVAELITWINKKLSGTVLNGKGAFILAFIVAVVGAIVKIFFIDHAASWSNFWEEVPKIWTIAQLFFVAIVEGLKLDVK